MPAVDFRLQGVAQRKQFTVSRRQILDDGSKPRPERVGRNPGFWRCFLGNKIEQNGSDLQSVGVDTIHAKLSGEAAVTGCFEGKNKERRRRRSRALLALKAGP